MADFKTHTSLGVLWGFGVTATGLLGGFLGFSQSIVVFVLSVIGSALPDIDSDIARPRQILCGILGIVVPVLVWPHLSSKNSKAEDMFCFMLFAYLFIQYVIAWFFSKFTHHRGIYHSIPAAIICGEIIFLIFTGSQFSARLTFAVACCGGYLLHLILDEIYSVDITGLAIKKSFGSALSWRSESKIGTILIYFLLLTIGSLCFLE